MLMPGRTPAEFSSGPDVLPSVAKLPCLCQPRPDEAQSSPPSAGGPRVRWLERADAVRSQAAAERPSELVEAELAAVRHDYALLQKKERELGQRFQALEVFRSRERG